MLKKPYKTGKTLSYYNLNLPFETLHINLVAIEHFIDTLDLQVRQDSLYGKSVYTNGISDLLKVEHSRYMPVAPSKITLRSWHYKKRGNTSALTALEIEHRLASIAARYRQTFDAPIGIEAVPTSNLIALEQASAIGFRRNTTVELYDVEVRIDGDIRGNMLLPPRIVEELFFAKGRRYAITVTNESIETVHAATAHLEGVELREYVHNGDVLRVPEETEADNIAVKSDEHSVLLMRKPALLSPATKEAFIEIAQEFIDTREKEIERIRIERDKEITDDDVLSVGEAESIAREAFGKIGRISFDGIQQFENFLEKVCDPVPYLPKSMEVDHHEGYAQTRFDTLYATLTHKGFLRLLKTRGRVDDTSLTVDRASLYFSRMDATLKERLIRIAQAAGLALDFTMDTAGQVFDTLCKLALLLSYPTPELLEKIKVAVKEGEPLKIGPLTLVPPILSFIRVVFIHYGGFIRPIYIPRHTALILIKPFLQVRSGTTFGSHSFAKPVYVEVDEQMQLYPPTIATPKPFSVFAYTIVTPHPQCSLEGVLEPYINEFVHMYGRLHTEATTGAHMYAFFESKRAINWRELVVLSSQIAQHMQESYYMCGNCVVSKDFAAKILALKILKEAVISAGLPAHLDPKKNVKRIRSQEIANVEQAGEQSLCSAVSYSMPIPADSVYHVQTAHIEEVDECPHQSEMLYGNITMPAVSFVLERSHIADSVSDIKQRLLAYYARFPESSLSSSNMLNCYFGDELSASIDMATTQQCTLFFSETILQNGVDASYMRDLIANRELGNADNVHPCRSHAQRMLLEYYTFITIEGNSGQKPRTYEEQKSALASSPVGKLYYISDELLIGGGTVALKALKFFYKRELTYIATIGHRRTFTYFDPQGIVYTIRDIEVSIEDEYVNIGGAKIKMDEPPSSIEVRRIDTDMSDFDFSFLHTLGMLQGIFIEPVPGAFIAPLDTQHLLSRTIVATSFAYDDSGDQEVTSSDSGANPLSKASISSPACESMAQTEIGEGDFIPANYETFVRLRIAHAQQTDGGLVVSIGDIAIPISYGVIDGYYSLANGELLMNAATTEMAKRVYQQGGYEKRVYYRPHKRTTAANITTDGDRVRIDFDYTKLSGKIVGPDGTHIDIDALQRAKTPEEIEAPGIYLLDALVEEPIVRIKSVTKNKHFPIGILGGERYAQQVATSEEEFAQLSSKYPIVVLLREDGLSISLAPAVVYSNGVPMKFKEA